MLNSSNLDGQETQQKTYFEIFPKILKIIFEFLFWQFQWEAIENTFKFFQIFKWHRQFVDKVDPYSRDTGGVKGDVTGSVTRCLDYFWRYGHCLPLNQIKLCCRPNKVSYDWISTDTG